VASGFIKLITTRRRESKSNHIDNLAAVPSFFQKKISYLCLPAPSKQLSTTFIFTHKIFFTYFNIIQLYCIGQRSGRIRQNHQKVHLFTKLLVIYLMLESSTGLGGRRHTNRLFAVHSSHWILIFQSSHWILIFHSSHWILNLYSRQAATN
jgi:hypothetical protein